MGGLPRPISRRLPFIVARCTQNRDPLVSTRKYSPVPLPSWYLPGSLAERTKAAVKGPNFE